MADHIVKSYDKELEALERSIAEMGGIAEKMVIDAMDALSQSDTALANQVIARDDRLDQLQREIEDNAVLTIARRQPMAVDLREIVARSASRATSNASAISPRTSPSVRSRSATRCAIRMTSSASNI